MKLQNCLKKKNNEKKRGTDQVIKTSLKKIKRSQFKTKRNEESGVGSKRQKVQFKKKKKVKRNR